MQNALKKAVYWMLMCFITLGVVILLLNISWAFQPKVELLEITESGNYIRLVTYGCGEGPCSSYSITLRENDTLRFYGLRLTQKLGEVIVDTPPLAYIKLSEYLLRNNFSTLPNCLYASHTDGPAFTLELSIAGEHKKVEYENCIQPLATPLTEAQNQTEADRFRDLFDKVNHRLWLML